MREENLPQELLVDIPNPNHSTCITSDQQIDEFVIITASEGTVMLPLLFTFDVEQAVFSGVEFKELSFARFEDHQESIVICSDL